MGFCSEVVSGGQTWQDLLFLLCGSVLLTLSSLFPVMPDAHMWFSPVHSVCPPHLLSRRWHTALPVYYFIQVRSLQLTEQISDSISQSADDPILSSSLSPMCAKGCVCQPLTLLQSTVLWFILLHLPLWSWSQVQQTQKTHVDKMAGKEKRGTC